MAVIEINNLVKKFGKFTVLDGINLDINEGEVFGYIGPKKINYNKITEVKILCR